MKKSLWTLLIIAIVYIIVLLTVRNTFANTWVNQILSLLYIWSPGFVALHYARKEKIHLPVFRNLKWGFLCIPALTALIVALSLGAFWAIQGSITLSQMFENQPAQTFIITFFSSYLSSFLITGILLFGGELYWRGYLWEKLKNTPPLKAIGLIALFWILWQLPSTFFAYSPSFTRTESNFLVVVLSTIVLSFPLLYFRLKYYSILASVFFLASLLSASVYCALITPLATPSAMALFGILVLGFLILFSLIFKLYFPSTWKKISK